MHAKRGLLLPLVIAVLAFDDAVATGQSDAGINLLLKEKPIPSDGSGVVNFSDIGGYLGPEDGLLCTYDTNFQPRSSYWMQPKGNEIRTVPNAASKQFGISNDVNCIHIDPRQGISLYYSDRGKPAERGLFQCILVIQTDLPPVNCSVHIVDMDVSTPTLNGSDGEIIISGDTVSISVSVTAYPDDTPIPYQWRVNGSNLPPDGDKYQGTRSNVLTIYNVESRDQGAYACLVAHSASGVTKSLNLTVVSIVVRLISVPSNSNAAKIGSHYTLTCTPSGLDKLNVTNIKYVWTKNGDIFIPDSEDSHTYKSLEFKNAGVYTCQIFITLNTSLGNRIINGTSNKLYLTFSEIVYRIYLDLERERCSEWTDRDIDNKVSAINNDIIDGMSSAMSCKEIHVQNFVTGKDTYHGYRCHRNVNSVMYETTIQAVSGGNTTLLVQCLDEWIAKTSHIQVYGVELAVDQECSGVLYKTNLPDCYRAIGLSVGYKVSIGFGSVIAVLIIVLIVVSCALMKYYRRDRDGYRQPNR